jgi:hypothetical protein
VSEASSIAGLTCEDSGGALWILTGGRSSLGLECHKVQSRAQLGAEFPGFVWPSKIDMREYFVSEQIQFVLFNEVTPVLLCTPHVARAFGKLEEGMRFTFAYEVVDAKLKIAELQFVYGSSLKPSLFVPKQLRLSRAQQWESVLTVFRDAVAKKNGKTGKMSRHIQGHRPFPEELVMAAVSRGDMSITAVRGPASELVFDQPWKTLAADDSILTGKYIPGGQEFVLGTAQELVYQPKRQRLSIRCSMETSLVTAPHPINRVKSIRPRVALGKKFN